MARKAKGRSKGLGTLERKGRVWRARWTVDGKTYTKTTGTSDRREAEKILAEIVAPFAAKTDAERLENLAVRLEGRKAEIRAYEDSLPALLISEAWTAYERSGTRHDTGAVTMDGYCAQFSAFADWMKENFPDVRELRGVTLAEAEAFAAWLKEARSAGTFNKYVTFFRYMWRVLADNPAARLTCNPWEKIGKREDTQHTRRELTIDELARVCGSVAGEMRLLFAVGIYTGLRLGDCCLLEWGSIDLARNRISTIPRKTARHAHGKPVIIPLHGVLASMLAEIPPDARTGYLLPETAKTYTRNKALVSRKIQRIFTDAGIKTQTTADEGKRAHVDVGFHSLRHTFVSLSANAGAPLAVVQAIVGHSNPAMTRHYFHESETALQSAVAALPSISLDSAQTAENAPDALPAPVAADEPVDGADAAQGRFSAFLAAVADMTDEELKRAHAEIDKRLHHADKTETTDKRVGR